MLQKLITPRQEHAAALDSLVQVTTAQAAQVKQQAESIRKMTASLNYIRDRAAQELGRYKDMPFKQVPAALHGWYAIFHQAINANDN